MNRGSDLGELHWMMGMLHSINAGLIVIDKEYKIHVWNEFMANQSAMMSEQVMGHSILDLFNDLPQEWFKRKVNSVFLLGTHAFTTWEQRDYLFRFKNYRPITGLSEFMYQNITFLPLTSVDGAVNHVGIIVYDVTDVAVNKQELESANTVLESLSRTDRLTELNNRGYWEECLENEFHRYKRTKQTATVIMFDIDHFKKVNDTYGHQAGDEVIRQTSKILKRSIRQTDIAGRYGGEEFGIILVNTPEDKAFILADRFRKRIEALTVTHENVKIKFTISLGISELRESVPDYTSWLECADQALYQSKEGGRNCTTTFIRKAS